MAKVLTFSTKFPTYHPKKGQPTYFVEKFWKSLKLPIYDDLHLNLNPKHHTIRASHRWKVGDYFSPRVWSGKPYNSKQIIIASDTLIVKTWDFEIDENGVYSINGKYTDDIEEKILAKNDGLNEIDLQNWFIPNYNKWNKKFQGQIICWNESVNY